MVQTTFSKRYSEVAIPALKEKFGYTNVYAIPALQCIVVNVGVGRLMIQQKGKKKVEEDIDVIAGVVEGVSRICGQRPVVIRSRKSIASFKLRAGMVNGLKVTLRKKRMKDFFERFIHIALPRTRDFRGIPRSSVDLHGNLTVGVKESTIFPELSDLNTVFGLEVTFVTTAATRQEGVTLLEKLGIPFQKGDKPDGAAH